MFAVGYFDRIKAYKRANLVRLWSMDQDSGTTIVDYSPNKSSGGSISGVTLANSKSNVGMNAAYWDGISDYIDVDSDLETHFATKTTGTLTFWVSVPSWTPVADGRFFDFWTSTNDYIRITNSSTTNRVQLQIRTNSVNKTYNDDSSKTADVFYQYVVTWDFGLGTSSFMDTYLNGSRIQNNVGTKDAWSGTWANCRIGTDRAGTSTPQEMTMGIVALYNTPFAQADVDEVYRI